MQGVFLMNPSVFDIRFEGVIVFAMGDGLLRNELASHLFFDEPSGQWRGWTTAFSALGTKSNKEEKAILAVTSDRILAAAFPSCVPDRSDCRGNTRIRTASTTPGLENSDCYFPNVPESIGPEMWESEHWDRGYQRLAGPVEMDSTGTLIQKIGQSRYVFFGSADRKVYIRSYPELKPVGELNLHRPPWNDATATRIWPNIIPLPDGYPAHYIALMTEPETELLMEAPGGLVKARALCRNGKPVRIIIAGSDLPDRFPCVWGSLQLGTPWPKQGDGSSSSFLSWLIAAAADSP